MNEYLTDVDTQQPTTGQADQLTSRPTDKQTNPKGLPLTINIQR
jgi:hypothetical protein